MIRFTVYYEFNGRQAWAEVQTSNASMAMRQVESDLPGAKVRLALPVVQWRA